MCEFGFMASLINLYNMLAEVNEEKCPNSSHSTYMPRWCYTGRRSVSDTEVIGSVIILMNSVESATIDRLRSTSLYSESAEHPDVLR
jgi:hypothetical protein